MGKPLETDRYRDRGATLILGGGLSCDSISVGVSFLKILGATCPPPPPPPASSTVPEMDLLMDRHVWVQNFLNKQTNKQTKQNEWFWILKGHYDTGVTVTVDFRCSLHGFLAVCWQQMQGLVVEGLSHTAISCSQWFLSETLSDAVNKLITTPGLAVCSFGEVRGFF